MKTIKFLIVKKTAGKLQSPGFQDKVKKPIQLPYIYLTFRMICSQLHSINYYIEI